MTIHDSELTRLLHDLGYYNDMYRLQVSVYNRMEYEDIVNYLRGYDIELSRVTLYLTLYEIKFLDPKRETWYKLKYN